MIIVGFSRPKKKFPIVSWLIRLVEGTSYSHSYIRWSSDWLERDVVYEASGTMVHFKESKRFDSNAETVKSFQIECSPETKKQMIQKAMDYSGAPYGLKQLLGILIVKICRWFGKDIKNPFSDGNKTWICSEIVFVLLKELNVDLPVSQDNITPRDICEALSKSGVKRLK